MKNPFEFGRELPSAPLMILDSRLHFKINRLVRLIPSLQPDHDVVFLNVMQSRFRAHVRPAREGH
jgi:hypothetical protein